MTDNMPEICQMTENMMELGHTSCRKMKDKMTDKLTEIGQMTENTEMGYAICRKMTDNMTDNMTDKMTEICQMTENDGNQSSAFLPVAGHPDF